jgi:hypothetical protein
MRHPARTKHVGTGAATVVGALGAVAIGAVAIGALAIGRLAIRRILVGGARFRSLQIGELTVVRLRVSDLIVDDRLSLPPSASRWIAERGPNAFSSDESGRTPRGDANVPSS